ncbi:MAG: serine/threonine protein kinase [Polyangiaceae bacterium]|nr:serine/threonine protein kinase [Polyangiaceae bacterium]
MVKTGDTIERYRIEDPIGEGGMGRVFRAHDERLDRRVALKVLHEGTEEKESRARLVREARAVAKLDHPNIVAVYDVGEHDGAPYVVMELVEGRSLRSLIGDAGVAPKQRVNILIEVARALAVAHDAGIVHRDIKPENVLVRPDGRVKVVDFGIARRTRNAADPSAPTDASFSTLTAEGVKVGTPMYMAPEQIKGSALDGRADQFAWGVVSYELFVGKPPWSGDAMGVIASVLTEEPAAPPAEAKMPYSLAGVVRRALAKRPEDRFASMRELLQSLDGALEAESAGRPSSGPPQALSALPQGAPTYASPVLAQARASSIPPVSPPYAGPPQYSPHVALSRRYNTKEVADIFDRALHAQQRRFRYEEIAEAGREIGLDDATIQEAARELNRRGTVPPSDRDKEHDMLRVKRLLAIWGVIATFFFLLNLEDITRDVWFHYPVVCIGVPFWLLIVRILFRAPKPAQLGRTADPALEHDVAQMTGYFRVRQQGPEARMRVNAGAPDAPVGQRAEHEAAAVAEAASVEQRARGER